MLDFLWSPDIWLAFATLTALEIVLGVDNIIFIAILSGRLPTAQRERARRIGLAGAFVTRLGLRSADREPVSGPAVAQAQVAAFRAWERVDGERFAKLRRITQPCLVINGVFDRMIPVRNSYFLAEHLPDATLLVFPDAGHGSLFQYPDAFVTQAKLFLG